MPLEYRQLGRTSLRVSSLGMGCVTFGREIDLDTSLHVLDRAFERGINLLDTAAVYGNGASEEAIGKWLKDRATGNRIIVASKVSGALSRGNILGSVEGSLRRLGLETIDLLQAHDWDANTPIEQTLGALDELVRAGKVRYIGCSNWTAGQLERATSITLTNHWRRVETIQPRYSLADRAIEADLLPLCAREGLGVISYSPLGAGFLTGKYRRGRPIPSGTRFDIKPGHQRIYFTDHGFAVVEALRESADRIGLSMTQLALSWVVRRPMVTSVLIGARDVGQVDQAMAAVDGSWDPAIARHLDEISQTVDAPTLG